MAYYLTFGIYLVIIAAGFLTGSLFYRKQNKNILPVIVILGYTMVSQTASLLAAAIIRNNLPIEHMYSVVSTALWGWFFFTNIQGSSTKSLIKWVTAALVVFFLINAFFIQGLDSFPDNAMKLATAFNLIWGFVLFIQQLDLPAGENVFRNPIFLVAIGLVWFNIISSFYFFLKVFLTKYNILPDKIDMLHTISNYLYYIIFLTAMIFLKNFNQHVRTIRN
ncbi:MAG: hypothetical protein EOO13_10395 [Chitinophagaceae bacterium]|nr:MAG: hypothetical protein EOO13_10395 [Chitinophagaceae bacterium]